LSKSVAVVGAGVVGSSAAYELALRGHRVTVFERSAPDDQGTSWGNAGMIVPSHFEPMASRGMLRLGLKLMFQPDAPFGIKWPGSPRLWSFLARFASHAIGSHENARRMILDLNLSSKQRYIELAEEWGFDFGLRQDGLLMVCKTASAFAHEAAFADSARGMGLNVEVLNPDELREQEPVYEGVAGAVRFVDDCSLDPKRFMTKLRAECERLGVEFRFSTPVHSWSKVGQGFEINGNSFDALVLACGANDQLLPKDILIQPGKGFGFSVTENPPHLRACAIMVEARVAITPMVDSVRITGTLVLGDRSPEVDERRLKRLLTSLGDYIPSIPPPNQGDLWVGYRPCSADGLPIVREVEPGCIVATGHGMMGMSLGPGSGVRVAELVQSGT
jgi:D-amino-acid dehydrogenase